MHKVFHPTSFKFKGYSCFKDVWAGFDRFTKITLVIGRNNSGKSQFLDYVEWCGENGKRTHYFPNLDQQFTWEVDRNFVDEYLSGFGGFKEICQQMEGAKIQWSRLGDSNPSDFELMAGVMEHVKKTVLNEFKRHRVGGATHPIQSLFVRRLFADRDITPEVSTTQKLFQGNGVGATNVIQQFMINSSLDSSTIEVDLLTALKKVFGSDARFTRIVARQNPKTKGEAITQDDKWEIYLEEAGKGWIPLSKSGSGLKTIILTLLFLHVLPKIENQNPSRYLFIFEELENNLHPSILRRLFDYITEYVKDKKCHVILSTHSSVALDYFGRFDNDFSQTIQVNHNGTTASTRTIQTHFDRVGMLAELGSKPSDLLQANGIIWVEGPSDRIYLNKFIEIYSEGRLREGIDYQCACYGGSVLANCEFTEHTTKRDLTNLARINSNLIVICDSDRTDDEKELKPQVERVQQELKLVRGAYIWITEPKEIEGYVPGEVWKAVYGLEGEIRDPNKFDSFPSSLPKEPEKSTCFYYHVCKRKSFDKTDFASKAVEYFGKNNLVDRFDLQKEILSLVNIIDSWNQRDILHEPAS